MKNEMVEEIISGNRRALARAITLAESNKKDHKKQIDDILSALPEREKPALRIGLSGTPGVGKSTFTEYFGMLLIEAGLKVAVLAIDPSSARSGGSILGDKTRMERLSREKNAFIRPSPSQTTLGGVAKRTSEAMRLCEAAGFDVIIIETVGVGQSETLVSQMTDIFLLLMAPAGGDELQGVKRGIMEVADIICVNKADGDLKSQAMRTVADYSGALRLMRKRPTDPEGFPKAMAISAVEGQGVNALWENIQNLFTWRIETGLLQKIRQDQTIKRFETTLETRIIEKILHNPANKSAIEEARQMILTENRLPESEIETLLTKILPQ